MDLPDLRTFAPGDSVPYDITEATDLDGDLWVRLGPEQHAGQADAHQAPERAHGERGGLVRAESGHERGHPGGQPDEPVYESTDRTAAVGAVQPGERMTLGG